jgi:hypothetical protein
MYSCTGVIDAYKYNVLIASFQHVPHFEKHNALLLLVEGNHYYQKQPLEHIWA